MFLVTCFLAFLNVSAFRGWFEMECIELDDGCIGPEQSSSDKAASAEVRMEIGASGSKAAGK